MAPGCGFWLQRPNVSSNYNYDWTSVVPASLPFQSYNTHPESGLCFPSQLIALEGRF
jgi:hypothetical protein